MGTFTMSRAAFEALKQAHGAVIINISATLHYGATWYQVGAVDSQWWWTFCYAFPIMIIINTLCSCDMS